MCKLLQDYTIPLSSEVLQPKKTTYAEETATIIAYDISYRTEQDRFEQKFVDYDVAMDI